MIKVQAHLILLPKMQTKSSNLKNTNNTTRIIKRRLGFHLGRLEAEEDALVLELEPLNPRETLKVMGLGCSSHHVVASHMPRRGI